MKFGYFDNKKLEYVITRPDTPTQWMNYLGNGGYSGIISNTAGGLSFDGDPSNRRVTRYKFTNQPIDRPGRYIYIRNEDTGEYWSPTWQPVLKDMQFYECRHGLGYTKITGTYDDVRTTITYYIPPKARYEIWEVEIENLSDKPKNLKLYSYVEFSFHHASFDMLCHWQTMALMCEFYGDKIICDTAAMQISGKNMYDYISTDLPICGYDCCQREFIGAYRDESNPQVLDDGICKNSIMHSDNAVGVLCSAITLAPGETKNATYTLGATEDKESIDAQIAEAFDKEKREAGFKAIADLWQAHLGKLQVNTPNADMDTMLNIWHSYQTRTTFDWSRFISVYERGVDRGFGFRDSMQDVLGVLHSIPEQSKERIKLLLSIQRNDGNARTVYYPATGESVGGGRSDDHLWSVFSVTSYVKETGDYAFLDEVVPYVDGGEATVLEHLEKGLEFTMQNLGPHGIPKFLGNDWNDSLWPISNDEQGRPAETTFVFFQLAHAAYELRALFAHMGLEKRKKKVDEIYEYCRSKLDTIWDGEWFIRAFTPNGEKYGTNDDEWNKIYLNPQSWSVLSRLPDKEKANSAMDNVLKYLCKEMGIISHYPASTGFDIKRKFYYLFPAGARENGGYFFHANTWAIMALALLGRNEDAYRCYTLSLPTRRNDIADVCMTEPYVYSQTMLAPPHNRAGACVNSWLTGTASWMYVTATQYILGVRPELGGLVIDPQIPEEWDGYTMDRLCRGTMCRIKVEKAAETELFVDGEKVNGNTVPWEMLAGKKEVNITLKLSNRQ